MHQDKHHIKQHQKFQGQMRSNWTKILYTQRLICKDQRDQSDTWENCIHKFPEKHSWKKAPVKSNQSRFYLSQTEFHALLIMIPAHSQQSDVIKYWEWQHSQALKSSLPEYSGFNGPRSNLNCSMNRASLRNNRWTETEKGHWGSWEQSQPHVKSYSQILFGFLQCWTLLGQMVGIADQGRIFSVVSGITWWNAC